jgi:hypothetical protein
MAAVPSDADALSCPPVRNVLAHRVNGSHHLVPWHTRILYAWERAEFREGVAVADPASLDLDPHAAGSGFRNGTFNQLEGTVGALYLNGTHVRHRDLHQPGCAEPP